MARNRSAIERIHTSDSTGSKLNFTIAPRKDGGLADAKETLASCYSGRSHEFDAAGWRSLPHRKSGGPRKPTNTDPAGLRAWPPSKLRGPMRMEPRGRMVGASDGGGSPQALP